MTKDEQDILALIRSQEEANRASDAKAVIAPLAEDAVVFDLPPPLAYVGADARHAQGLEAWFDSWRGPVSVELADPQIWVDGDLAVAFGLSRMRGEKKDGGPVDSWNRRTIVLRRIDGRWQIAHEHSSYPMMMDGSGKAATDLSP